MLAARIPHASIDELQSAGYEGLIEAAMRYDPSIGVPFASYAHFRVRGAMIDAARRADYDHARSLLKLPNLETPDIGAALFGEVTIDNRRQRLPSPVPQEHGARPGHGRPTGLRDDVHD